jgi:hypothetical protein
MGDIDGVVCSAVAGHFFPASAAGPGVPDGATGCDAETFYHAEAESVVEVIPVDVKDPGSVTECSGTRRVAAQGAVSQTIPELSPSSIGYAVVAHKITYARVSTLTNGIVDTTTAQDALVFGVFALMAEYEAALIRERTQAGLAAARARGRRGGRKPKMTPALIDKAQRMYDVRRFTMAEIAASCSATPMTIYRNIHTTHRAALPTLSVATSQDHLIVPVGYLPN